MTTFGNGDFSGAAQGAGNFLSNNSQGLLGLSAGLLSGQGWNQGLSQGFQGFNQGHQQDTRTQDKKKADAATQQLLATMPNLTPAQVQAFKDNPQLAQAAAVRGIDAQMAPPDYTFQKDAQGNLVRINTQTGATSNVGAQGQFASPSDQSARFAAGAKMGLTGSDLQRYALTGSYGDDTKLTSVGQGDALVDKSGKVVYQNGQGGPPAPAGYRYGQGGNLEAIPGGPATKLESADAAKVAMADQFLQQAPTVRAKLANGVIPSRSGMFTDPMGTYNTAFSHGDQGDIQRTIAGGKEALVRALTGQGMSESEAQNQAAQYDISMNDTPSDQLNKFDNLTKRLQGMKQELGVGRGGDSRTGGSGGASDPLGIR